MVVPSIAIDVVHRQAAVPITEGCGHQPMHVNPFLEPML